MVKHITLIALALTASACSIEDRTHKGDLHAISFQGVNKEACLKIVDQFYMKKGFKLVINGQLNDACLNSNTVVLISAAGSVEPSALSQHLEA